MGPAAGAGIIVRRLPAAGRGGPARRRGLVIGLRAGPVDPAQRQRYLTMEPTHEFPAPGSIGLDNSHNVIETLVYAPSVESEVVQVELSPVRLIAGTPRTSGRLMDEDFTAPFGDIHSSAAQITTRRMLSTGNPPTIRPTASQTIVVSQDQLAQLRLQYEAAELMATIAEAEERTALARKSAQRWDTETRAKARRSASSSVSPRASSQTPTWALPSGTRRPVQLPHASARLASTVPPDGALHHQPRWRLCFSCFNSSSAGTQQRGRNAKNARQQCGRNALSVPPQLGRPVWKHDCTRLRLPPKQRLLSGILDPRGCQGVSPVRGEGGWGCLYPGADSLVGYA